MCLIKYDKKLKDGSSFYKGDPTSHIITSKYTLLHGKTYDFTNFKHPGGQVAIALAHGRDATEMFEVMHQFCSKEKLQAILKKYEVNFPFPPPKFTISMK
jgi:Cytochrome b5-like Heme/Steroid binding domain